EPKFELEDVPYTHRVTDNRPLTFRRLFAPHARSLVLATLLVILETVTLQAGPYLTAIGIDKGITPKNLTVIIAPGVAYIVLVCLTALFSGLRVAYTGRIGQRLLYDLRLRIFAHQLRLSLDYFTREKAGVIMTRMTSDVEALNQLFQDGLVSLMVQG